MPNLAVVVDNPDLLKESVARMMRQRGCRGEVRMNHGIRNAQELEEHVAKAGPVGDIDPDAYRALLKIEPGKRAAL